MQPEDWDYLLHLADMHRLESILAARLGEEEFRGIVPADVIDRLRERHRRHSLHNLAIYRELVEVTRLLNEAGIPSVALKGAYLARFVYPDIGLRPMRDLDLLLPGDKLIEAYHLLETKGYQPVFDAHLPTTIEIEKHLPGLVSPEGVLIELHHRLMDPDGDRNTLLRDDTWQRTIARTISGTVVHFLCQEDLLLHLCVHAAHDHELNVGPQVLADIALLVQSHELDWNDFRRGVESGGWQRYVLPLLDMAQRHLGVNIPVTLNDSAIEMRKTAEDLLFCEREDHRMLPESVQQIRSTAGLGVKLKALASRVFLSREEMSAQYPVDPRSVKIFLYYPRRWFRLFTEVLPKLLKGYARDSSALDDLAAQKQAFRQWLRSGNG